MLARIIQLDPVRLELVGRNLLCPINVHNHVDIPKLECARQRRSEDVSVPTYARTEASATLPGTDSASQRGVTFRSEDLLVPAIVRRRLHRQEQSDLSTHDPF